ncbi:MAG: hypothetical protein J0M12_15025 [Deltaproteobacteria bacterium]|nr:hypothetical protein [Deltaproteobacteria bacterium]
MKGDGSPFNINKKLLALLLKPIVRFSMRRSLSIQTVQEVLRKVFIEVAKEEIEEAGESPNASRISVMTGLSRREVSASHDRSESEAGERAQPIFARVLAQWEQDRRYRNAKGQVRTLSYEGDKSEFARLVRSISAHVKPATVLFELQRNGAIETSEKGVTLRRATIDATVDHVRAFTIVSKDISALIEAVLQNLDGNSNEQDVHIRTEYDNIYLKDLPEIRQWLIDEARAFHKRARDFISNHDKDVFPTSSRSEAGGKVMVSMFSHASSPSSGSSAQKNDHS